jgi:ribonuclease HIII
LNDRSTEIPVDLRLLLEREGVEITASRPIDHGTQYDLARNGETAKLNVYHTGKVSAGGRASGLRDLLEIWRALQTKAPGEQAPARPAGASAGARPVLDSTSRLGIDEAGKGDYFGPLVVAGVRIVGSEQAKSLWEIGVRDSKEISVPGVRRISDRIQEVVGRENVRVVSLSPREYEARRGVAGNVNRLLGELDAAIIGELANEVEVVVVDEFARSARDHLRPFVPGGVRLEVRPRAEDDAAVAAASIVARARQLEGIEHLSGRVGFRLPLGATHVVDAGRRVVDESGEDGLAEVAKIHFATTRRVLERSDGGRPC